MRYCATNEGLASKEELAKKITEILEPLNIHVYGFGCVNKH